MALSRTQKTLLIVGGIVLALVLAAIVGLAILVSSLNRGTNIENNSVLVLKVSGDMPDFAPDDPTAQLFGGGPKNSFASFLTQLRKARVDSRIAGVLLDIEGSSLGLGKSDELRAAILEFRTSGKPVYAFMESGDNKEYYIATAADKIFVPPPGTLAIIGFQAQQQFYKNTLDKIGVDFDVVAVGKYKGAADSVSRTEPSDESREVTNALLDDYYGRFINTIAEARQKSSEEVKTIVDNAPYNAVEAQSQNLIDGAKYRDEVLNEFKARLGYKEADELKLTGATAYKEVTPESLGLNNGEKVAVIFASGLITSGRSADGSFGGTQSIGSDTIVRAVRNAADDESVKAIVLRVDSGGGSALASDIMWHTLEYARAKKPVVTSMGDVAASGGYYIAANSHKIVAEPSTITGSIGVILARPTLGGLYDKIGVTNEYNTRGKNAGLLREDQKWTDEQRAVIQKSANFFYWDNFVPKVAQGRGRTVEQIHEVAQGRVWTGAQAKERGLVDEFGGLNKAIDIAKNLANLPADKDVKRVIFPTPRPFFESFFSARDEEATVAVKVKAEREAVINALPKDLQKAFRSAARFDNFDDGEALTMLPFDLEIK